MWTVSLVASAVAVGVLACTSNDREGGTLQPTLARQQSGVEVRLQAVSAVDEWVAWVSGLGGTYARTTDGGASWRAGIVPGAESMQFRDIHAEDSLTAYLLSAGRADSSRIYKTVDGGATWALQFVNAEPDAFFDCFDFWDANTGVAFSDAVAGRLIVIRTVDGRTWERVPDDGIPHAVAGEGGFAASGTCLVAQGDTAAWIATGAGTAARVLATRDRGVTWTATEVPVTGGTSTSGLTSLAFVDEQHGLAAGGDIQEPSLFSDNVATTADGGRTWRRGSRPTFSGAVYGMATVPSAPTPTVVAVGPRGAAYSTDLGLTWTALDSADYWSVSFASPRAGWAVGPGGRIVKIRMY
jgi:photosystem II stability/assembly factor-like uncharacterized protein